MMFNAICPLKTVLEQISEAKIKCFHIIFCITGAYNKLLVQKVHLIVAEPFKKTILDMQKNVSALILVKHWSL